MSSRLLDTVFDIQIRYAIKLADVVRHKNYKFSYAIDKRIRCRCVYRQRIFKFWNRGATAGNPPTR